MERDVDYLGKYRLISSKLKKKFLRKPNIAEGSEHFGQLAKTLQQQECPQYAAFCCLAQARCENTLANAPGEAQALTEAGRLFLEAEFSNRQLGCPSFDEHLNAAINCFSHAIRVHVENKQAPLAAALCLELGNALKRLGRADEAIAHYQRAAELQFQNPLDCLTALGLVAECKMNTNDYEGALSVYTEMTYLAQERGGGGYGGRPLGVFHDILAQCEINRVLLLMLLQPTPQRIRPEHAHTLEKYTWQACEDDDEAAGATGGKQESYLDPDLFLLLQSVVLACQSADIDALSALEGDLWPLLTPLQNELLHRVIEELSHPAGQPM